MKTRYKSAQIAVAVAVITASGWGQAACKHRPPTKATQAACLKDDGPEQLNIINQQYSHVFRHFLRDDCPVVGPPDALGQTVTMVSSKPVSSKAAWDAFNSAIQAQGYGVARSDRTYTLVPDGAPLPAGAVWEDPALRATPTAVRSIPNGCLKIRPDQPLDLTDQSVDDLLRYFLADDCDRWIMADASVLRTKLTVVTDGPVSSQEAWKTFNDALHAAGYTMVQTDKYYKLIESAD